jgi:ankyrin repeat protein
MIQKFKNYENIDKFIDKDNDIESLLVYTTEYWPHHLRDTDRSMDEAIAADVSRLYDTDGPLFGLWFIIFWKATNPYSDPPQMNAIRLAALLGHGQILKAILQSNQHYDINESDKTGCTGLIWASQRGHTEVVQMLLERGADVNAGGGWYGNALHAASRGGHTEVVQMLLGAGAYVNVEGGGEYGNALQAASAGGHTEVVQMLRDKILSY